jgi:hypothetical protein
MARILGLLIVVALVAWLAMTQLNAAGDTTREAAEAAGVELDADTQPTDVARQVGAQVDATVAAGKARLDAAADAASGGDDSGRADAVD